MFDELCADPSAGGQAELAGVGDALIAPAADDGSRIGLEQAACRAEGGGSRLARRCPLGQHGAFLGGQFHDAFSAMTILLYRVQLHR